MINEPSLAILIDCWDLSALPLERSTAADTLSNNILEFINKTDVIETVVLSSYDCESETTASTELWYQNRDLIYGHPYQKDNSNKERKTSPYILSYVNPCKFQIAMHQLWELKLYLSKNSHIKNIYVLGIAWDICIRNRPLGVDNLKQLSGVNILTNINCVLTSSFVYPSIDEEWRDIGSNIYCYNQNEFQKR